MIVDGEDGTTFVPCRRNVPVHPAYPAVRDPAIKSDSVAHHIRAPYENFTRVGQSLGTLSSVMVHAFSVGASVVDAMPASAVSRQVPVDELMNDSSSVATHSASCFKEASSPPPVNVVTVGCVYATNNDGSVHNVAKAASVGATQPAAPPLYAAATTMANVVASLPGPAQGDNQGVNPELNGFLC